MTLGQLCTEGIVWLEVACQRCPRRGRYRVTRLIDEGGAGKSLAELKAELAANCPKFMSRNYFDRCDVWFPGVMRKTGKT